MNRWMRRGCKGNPRKGNPRRLTANCITIAFREARAEKRRADKAEHGVPPIEDAWVVREWTDKDWDDFRANRLKAIA